MRGILEVDPSDAVPIWRQIEDGMRRLAVSGQLPPGAAVPSVRDLARELTVNPATVAKAYQRLVDAGVLSVRRGEGTFVTERPDAEVERDRLAILGAGARRLVDVARTIQADRSETLHAVEVAWDESAEMAGGGEG